MPLVGGVSPATIRARVVLPLPLSPDQAERLLPLRATDSPRRRPAPWCAGAGPGKSLTASLTARRGTPRAGSFFGGRPCRLRAERLLSTPLSVWMAARWPSSSVKTSQRRQAVSLPLPASLSGGRATGNSQEPAGSAERRCSPGGGRSVAAGHREESPGGPRPANCRAGGRSAAGWRCRDGAGARRARRHPPPRRPLPRTSPPRGRRIGRRRPDCG